MKKHFSLRTLEPLAVLSSALFLVTFLFVAKQVGALNLVDTLSALPNTVFYFLFLCIFITWIYLGRQAFTSGIPALREYLTRSLTFFLPATLFLMYGISASHKFHFIFQVSSGLLLILTLGLLFWRALEKQPRPLNTSLSFRDWFRKQGVAALFAVVFFTALFFSFATYRLGEFAAVDEPLWLYGRIPKFWNNVSEQEWQKTDVSDKPGITVALISGVGMLRYDPNEFDDRRADGEIFMKQSPLGMESFFFTYRFPLVLFITILLPLLYFLLERLMNRQAALLSYAFLTTSPILIGMAKIINPDALLWLFTTLSLVSFLVFQKRNWYRYLLLSGFFLGLALLTKYIANIIFIYLLALLFLEYIYHARKTQKPLTEYIEQGLFHIGFVAFCALTTFYILLPANWTDPSELIRATLLSEAFIKVAPLFLLIFASLLLDKKYNQSRLTASLLLYLLKAKVWIGRVLILIFGGALIFTFWNTVAGMPVYNFIDLISSPKTIERRSDMLGAFLTNFYPLIFSLMPLALVGLGLALFFLWHKKFSENDSLRFAFYAIIFTIIYYFGATVNGVGSIIRYQIIIFPLIALVSGIGISHLATLLQKKYPKNKMLITPIFLVIIGAAGIFTLLKTPFPLSYASSLLPSQYYVDLKDMGPGSFEIAQMLNGLPDAKNTLIWTDKDGVCQFFIGRCKRGSGVKALTDQDIDYFVISSARENRTDTMVGRRYENDTENVLPIHLYYDRTDAADFTVLVNGRTSHYIKAFKYNGAE